MIIIQRGKIYAISIKGPIGEYGNQSCIVESTMAIKEDHVNNEWGFYLIEPFSFVMNNNNNEPNISQKIILKRIDDEINKTKIISMTDDEIIDCISDYSTGKDIFKNEMTVSLKINDEKVLTVSDDRFNVLFIVEELFTTIKTSLVSRLV